MNVLQSQLSSSFCSLPLSSLQGSFFTHYFFITQTFISSSESSSHLGLHCFGLHCFGLQKQLLLFYSKIEEIFCSKSGSTSYGLSAFTYESFLWAPTDSGIGLSPLIIESDLGGTIKFSYWVWFSIITVLEISASPKSSKSTLRFVFIILL